VYQGWWLIILSHLLFVDDILLFYDGLRRDDSKLKEILSLYNSAIGMEVDVVMSILSFSCIDY
jgi:hypothetical protein